MEGGLLLNVVIRESTSILQLLPCRNKTLLIWRNTFLVLDLGLHIVDGVAWLHIKSDSFTSQRFHKDLHTTTKTQHEMKGGLFLDVVIGESTSIFQLLSRKNKTLLI